MEEEKRIPFYELSVRYLENSLENGEASANGNPSAVVVRNRRDAFRALKVNELRGHEYLLKYFYNPTFCSFCNEFLW